MQRAEMGDGITELTSNPAPAIKFRAYWAQELSKSKGGLTVPGQYEDTTNFRAPTPQSNAGSAT